jgi:phospholipid/cholesterol/gamma-HCH transport system substrate-binding protein
VTTAIRKHLGDFIALTVLFVIAIGVSVYILANQEARSRVPFIEAKAFKLTAAFSDAQAVTPGQGQSIRVAGVKVGKLTKVDLKNGVAIVTMEIDPKYKDKLNITSNATALLRPRTGLKDMFVELDPGSGGRKLKEGDEIPVENTAPDIDPDEFLSALDSDTRQYLQILINGVGKGLNGRGNDLNATFKALEPTNRDLRRVAGAVAERRSDLKKLIADYGDLTNTLGKKDKDIARLVSQSEAVFSAFASQNENIASAVAKLPPTLRQTRDTLIKADSFGKVLGPASESLRAPFRALDTANHQVIPFVTEAAPLVRNHIRPFVQDARPYVRNLKPASVNLAKALPDLKTSFFELNRFFNMLSYNPKGREAITGNPVQDRARDEGYLFWLGWVVQNTNSLFNTSDAQGAMRRALAGLSCTTIRERVAGNPVSGPLLGYTNQLNTTGICGGTGGPPPVDTGIVTGPVGEITSPLPVPPLGSLPTVRARAERAGG